MMHMPRLPARGSLIARAGLLAMLVGVTASPVSAQRSAMEQVRDTVLANGLQIIAVRNTTVPLATIEVVVRTGAFSQLTPEDEGVPHLLEHMLFQNGFDSDAIKAEAITYNARTESEAVSYYVTVPSRNLERGLKIMADLVRNQSFDREALKAEQKVVSGELQRRAAEPQFLLYFQSNAALWGDGWSRKNPGGNIVAVTGATTDRLKDFVRKYYIPNNAAVVVTGDVTAPDVFAFAAKSFQSWKRGDDPFKDAPVVPMPALKASRTGIVEAPVPDLTFLVQWQGPSVTTDTSGTYAADVFSELVNQPLSALQRRLVDSGLFQSVSLSYETQRNVGPIELYARTTPEKLEAAGAALKKEIRQFSTPGYFTDLDVTLAKKRQQVLMAFQAESATSVAHPIGSAWSVAGLDYYRGYVDKVRAQTPADVQRFVQTYLTGKPMTVTILVSPDVRRSMSATLNGILSKWTVE